MDEEIQGILSAAFDRASSVLGENREMLDRLSDLLVEHEEIAGHRVKELTGAEKQVEKRSAEG